MSTATTYPTPQLVAYDDETNMTAFWLSWDESYIVQLHGGTVAQADTLDEVEAIMAHYAADGA